MRAALGRAAAFRVILGSVPDGYRRATDLAGPDVIRVPEAVRLVCEHDGRRIPRLITLPAVGARSPRTRPGPTCQVPR